MKAIIFCPKCKSTRTVEAMASEPDSLRELVNAIRSEDCPKCTEMKGESMKTVEARRVVVGDRIYDKTYFAPDKWVLVKKVGGPDERGYVSLDVGHCVFVKYGREGVAIK